MSRARCLGGLFLLTGCAGARANLVAQDAHVPVSMSRAVRDASGQLVPQRRLLRVGTLSAQRTAWSTLYSALPLSGRKDVSADVDAQVRAHGGDAIVNATLHTKSCALDWFFPLTVLPIWPGCSRLELTGDIVKLRPEKSAPRPGQVTQADDPSLQAWLYDHCAYLGAAESPATSEAGLEGLVEVDGIRFACVEAPPGRKTAWVPASETRVLCLEPGDAKTCVPPIDPALALRHAETLARVEAAKAESARAAEPPPKHAPAVRKSRQVARATRP